MKFLKSVAVVLAFALPLAVTSLAASASPVAPAPIDQAATTVNFVFEGSCGYVYVRGLPGSTYAVNCPGPFGVPMVLFTGGINQAGFGQGAFVIPPWLDVTSITVTVLTPGLPPLLFVYDSDLDRWILD